MASSLIPPRPAADLSGPSGLGRLPRRTWAIVYLAVKTFSRIDGAQWAGALAFNSFFSLFPLVLLLVSIASAVTDRDSAGSEIITYMGRYIPISGEMQSHIFDAISGVVEARGQVGAISFVILVWAAIQCFTTLICVTNRAWGIVVSNWWRLSLKSLVLLCITAAAIILGMAVPVLARMTKVWLFPIHEFSSWVYAMGSVVIPLSVAFLSLSLFYKLAPLRPTRFDQVWVAALYTTVMLQVADSLFVIYLKNFATLNAVYGVFGGIMALLLWIYLSGSIFIFGACLCAAQSEICSVPVPTTVLH